MEVCRTCPAHLASVDFSTDDWKGIVDVRERRRRQNRLNQRAYKLRKRRAAWQQHLTPSIAPGQSSENASFGMLVPSTRADSSEPQLTFPLTVDHLLSLIHYNVYRAILANSLTMSLSHFLSTCQQSNTYTTSLPLSGHIPESLIPTQLQLSVPHEPTIDFFPLARLRDNVICAGKSIWNTGEFCRDLLGTLFHNHHMDNADRNGLIVWGEPWDINAWECTPGFVSKWGWLLDGCEELLRSTNRWREVRGEHPLL